MNEYCKLPTNIKPLDELTNGGIILNVINVIAAGCGSGKSILSTMIGLIFTRVDIRFYFSTFKILKQLD